MGIIAVLQLLIMLGQGVATSLGKAGLATEAEGVLAAIAKLREVHGTLLTKDQVDSLHITPEW